MILFILLGVAAGVGLLGFGILSMLILFALWNLLSSAPQSMSEFHKEWLRRSLKIGLLAHLGLLAIIAARIWFVMDNDGDGWWQAFIANYVFDHVAEACISVWLAYRAVSGGVKYHQSTIIATEPSESVK